MISFIPVIFQPTATLLIDDDEFFIDNVKRLLPKEININIVEQEKFATLYCSNLFYASGNEISDLCLMSMKSLTSFFDSATELPVSTIIMDQFMSHKNGLEILSNLKSPFIKKILISNNFSDKEAIEALNEGIIDFYLCKMDHAFIKKLTNAIYETQYSFFKEVSLTIPGFFSNENPLTKKETLKIFDDIKNNFGMTYYKSNHNLRKFKFSNTNTTESLNLQIIPEDELNELLKSHQAESVSPEILSLIKVGKILPCFDGNFLPDGEQWNDYLQSAHSFQAKQKYFYSIYNETKNASS